MQQMIGARVPLVTPQGLMTTEWFGFMEALRREVGEMTQTPSRLATVALVGAQTVVYTVPPATRTTITAATLCNSTGAAVPCTVWLVPAGGTPNTGNLVLSAVSVAAGATRICSELVGQVLAPGGQIIAIGAGVALVASGTEST